MKTSEKILIGVFAVLGVMFLVTTVVAFFIGTGIQVGLYGAWLTICGLVISDTLKDAEIRKLKKRDVDTPIA